jgi:LemA protein
MSKGIKNSKLFKGYKGYWFMAYIALLIVLGVVVLLFVLFYNKLVSLKNQTENAWSQIDVQLKRRSDLIPNLVEAVKGYMNHEKTTLKNLTELRTKIMSGSVKSKAKANDQLSDVFKTIFAVAENYPRLKASKNFLHLQDELSATENKISYARQFYNDAVYGLNNAVQSFPTNLIANMFGFSKKEFFEATQSEKRLVKIKF